MATPRGTMLTPIEISSPAGTNVGVEYATANPYSYANKHLLLTMSGGWIRLHDTEGTYIRTLPSYISTSSRPRWSRGNPDVFTYIQWRSLWSFNVATNTAAMLREFTEYIVTDGQGRNGLDDGGEADLSADGAYRVFSGKKLDGTVEVFGYDIATNVKGTPLPVSNDVDGLKLSQDLRIVLSKPAGIFVTEGLAWRKIYPRNAHAVPCMYKGRASLAVFNGAQHLEIVDLDTAQQTVVPFVIDYAYVGHVSACDKPFLGVSLSGNGQGQIVIVSLEDLSAKVVCEFKTNPRSNDYQPKGSLSRDGSRIVFTVDDGIQATARMLKLDDAAQPVPSVLTFDLMTHDVSISKGVMKVRAA